MSNGGVTAAMAPVVRRARFAADQAGWLQVKILIATHCLAAVKGVWGPNPDVACHVVARVSPSRSCGTTVNTMGTVGGSDILVFMKQRSLGHSASRPVGRQLCDRALAVPDWEETAFARGTRLSAFSKALNQLARVDIRSDTQFGFQDSAVSGYPPGETISERSTFFEHFGVGFFQKGLFLRQFLR